MRKTIVCIEPYGNGGLTYGTEYEVVNYVEPVHEFVEIINNFGHNTEYLRKRFATKEEWREMKLNELGI
jgi:hypothetical protein